MKIIRDLDGGYCGFLCVILCARFFYPNLLTKLINTTARKKFICLHVYVISGVNADDARITVTTPAPRGKGTNELLGFLGKISFCRLQLGWDVHNYQRLQFSMEDRAFQLGELMDVGVSKAPWRIIVFLEHPWDFFQQHLY